MSGINLHLYYSDMYFESRILKISECLAKTRRFDSIHLAGISKAGTDTGYANYRDGVSINRFDVHYPFMKRFRFGKQICFLLYLVKLFGHYVGKDVPMVNCHGISVLPVGLVFRLFKGSVVIYDTHELESKKINVSPLESRIYRIFEKLSFPYIDAQFVVSDHIGNYYSDMYGDGKKIHVVYNKPRYRNLSGNRDLREKLGLGSNEIVYLYQGLLARGRGIDLLLDVFRGMERNRHIVFMGSGVFEGRVKDAGGSCRNIHYMEPVPPDRVVDVAMSADVGLSIIENVSLSYYYSLPNKVFEYLMAGLPILVSDFPEMESLVSRYDCGWSVKVCGDELRNFIAGMDKTGIEEKKEHVLKNRMQFSWEGEESRLLESYESVLGKPRPNGNMPSARRAHG